MRFGAVLLSAALSPAALAAWTLRDRGPDDPAGDLQVAQAVETNRTLEVVTDADGAVWLAFRLPPDAAPLQSDSCPTLQIDQRVPVFNPAIGADCKVSAHAAVLRIGSADAKEVRSGPLSALVNGRVAAVRYLTHDHRYVEIDFPLRHSMRAIKRAVGGRRIHP